MLWYKGWLETRFRLLIIVGYTVFLLFFQHSVHNATPPPGGKNPVLGFVLFSNPILVVVACALLGGAGIVTQSSLQVTKGLHGSTLFTLSLPVTRLRLLVTRAAIGWLEMVAVIATLCCGMWIASPAFRALATPMEMIEYAGTLIACASALYCVSALLATFLDDQWRSWGTMMASLALWLISTHSHLPASINIFRAMREGSPIVAHSVPWTAMVFSLALAAVLFFAALKVAQTREY